MRRVAPDSYVFYHKQCGKLWEANFSPLPDRVKCPRCGQILSVHLARHVSTRMWSWSLTVAHSMGFVAQSLTVRFGEPQHVFL